MPRNEGAPDVAVTVVVAAYNAQPYLAECIDSVLAQSGVDVELIVVDDGSTDGTREVARRYGDRIRYLWRPNSGGCSVPRNDGARVASTDLVTFFDADDVMVEGKLAWQVDLLRKCPQAGAVVTDYHNFHERSGPLAHTHFDTCVRLREAARRHPEGAAACVPAREVRVVMQDENVAGSPMYRREIFDALGGFDESLRASEDFDLLYRTSLTHALAVVPRVGFHRRLHDGNMTGRPVHMLAHQSSARAKLAALEPDPALRARLRRTSRNLRIALIEQYGRLGDTRAAVRELRGAYPAIASRAGMRAVAWGLGGSILRRILKRGSALPAGNAPARFRHLE